MVQPIGSHLKRPQSRGRWNFRNVKINTKKRGRTGKTRLRKTGGNVRNSLRREEKAMREQAKQNSAGEKQGGPSERTYWREKGLSERISSEKKSRRD